MEKIGLGQTVSILANIGVIAGIIFLALELRQNTDAVRANTYQELNAVVQAFNSMFIANPEVSEFFVKTADIDYDLQPEEAMRLRAFISSFYRHADNAYFQYKLGTLTEEQMRSLLVPIILNIQRRPRLRQEWEDGVDRLLLTPELAEYMDREISSDLTRQ